jgi:hypothetical protein
MTEAEANLLQLFVANARIKNPISCVYCQPLGQWQASSLTEAIRKLLATQLCIVNEIIGFIQALIECEANTPDNVIAVNPARNI